MKSIITLVLILALTGCMSEREYMLERPNADNAAAHPATFDVLTIKGPVNIAAGAELTTRAPTQPFQPLVLFPTALPRSRALVRDIVTGAVIGFGLHQAGNKSSSRTVVTGGAE